MNACLTQYFRATLALCACLLALVIFSTPASAGEIPAAEVIFSAQAINPNTGESMGETTIPIAVNSDDTFYLGDGSFDGPNDSWNLTDVFVSGDIDPFVSSGFNILNNAAITMNFIVSVSVPIVPIPGASFHGGSTGISVTDANASGSATVSALAGKSYYSGQIDGSTVLSLFSDPHSLTALGAGQSNSENTSAGLVATLPSGPALLTIGIVNEFSLTPGDHMSSTNFFRVEPNLIPNDIPEPSTMLLSGLALVGICGLRRRRAGVAP